MGDQMAILEDLMMAWAETSGFKYLNERCTGYYDLVHNNIPDNDAAEWECKLHILESFHGSYFHTLPKDLTNGQSLHATLSLSNQPGQSRPTLSINWDQSQIDNLNIAFETLKIKIYKEMVLQTRLAPVMDLIGFSLNPLTGEVAHYNFSLVKLHFQKLLAADPINGLIDLLDFNRNTSFPSGVWDGEELFLSTLQSLGSTDLLNDFLTASGFTKDDEYIYGSTAYSDIKIINDQTRSEPYDEDGYADGSGRRIVGKNDRNDTLIGGSGRSIL